MKRFILFLMLCSMGFGQSPNFFYSYLTSGISSTDTTVTFTASDTTYASTNTSFYATIWQMNGYANAAEAFKAGKAEIVLVNSRTSNTFDIERAQLGTTARSFNTSGKRYKIQADVYGANIPAAISSSTNGLYLTNDGSATAWDTIPSQVDMIVPITLSSNFGAQATNYCPYSSAAQLSTSSTSGADINHSILGVTGTVVGLVVNYRANTKTATDSVILWKNNATTNVKLTIASGVLNGADTTNTVSVLPTDKWQLKFVNSSGSGTSTGISAVIRLRLNLR